jgi:glycosyltransferase involved in cell wall biosynthesis
MRIAIVASPFIPAPPVRYGGTELFVSNLAEALKAMGETVVVYSNGESTVDVEVRWRYREAEWPLPSELSGITKELDHLSWALRDASEDCDIIHVNSAPAVTFSPFVPRPFVCTLHHPFETELSNLYERNPQVSYVAISHHQAVLHQKLDVQTIHHGIDLNRYRLQTRKDGYLCFLGRITPLKGTHTAIEIAKKTGIPLKIAGEIQPIFRDYFDAKVKPHIDGRFIEYVGEADLNMKNQLLGGAAGMLFPIHWEEPFGLVMLESMACGTPVFAFRAGAVPEVICEDVSGSICTSVDDMVSSIEKKRFDPFTVRSWVEQMFSADAMAAKYLECYQRILDGETEPDGALEDSGELAA